MIKPENLLIVFAFIVGWSAFAMYAEGKWKWATKISSLGIAIIGPLILVNLNILPVVSPAYDVVYDYILPLAIPLLLFNANIKKIYKESGRSLIVFHIACIGSFIGAIVAGFLFIKNPNIVGIVAMQVGAGTGGSVNQVALAETFGLGGEFISAAVIAGNLCVVIYLFILGIIPNTKFFLKHFSHPHIDESMKTKDVSEVSNVQSDTSRPFTAIDAGKIFGIALAIFGISSLITTAVNSANLPIIITQIFGNIYLMLTLITTLAVTIYPKFFDQIIGVQEIGTLMLMMFFTTMGAGAKIIDVIKLAPIIFVIEFIMILVNLIVVLFFGRLFKFDLEEMLISSNAAYGGPSTAVGYVINKGWSKLAVPAVLIGVYGYIIGNLLGILAGNLFSLFI